jgi:hypothetical protein
VKATNFALANGTFSLKDDRVGRCPSVRDVSDRRRSKMRSVSGSPRDLRGCVETWSARDIIGHKRGR